MKILFIVESPNKIKKIKSFLSDEYIVRASVGHIRNLAPKELSIDIENGFKPIYVIYPEKKKVVSDLKMVLKHCDLTYLATDYDLEGEAIAWHLKDVLKLKKENTKRILFTEITKKAILNAIASPTEIDNNMVDAQKARRILDRIIGYKVSPVLWKQIQNNYSKGTSLSAGRVQSIVTRIIIEREDKISEFESSSFFRTTGIFSKENDTKENDSKENDSKENDTKENKIIQTTLNYDFQDKDEATSFLDNCKEAEFKVDKVTIRKTKRKASPPFITSTLQQEASNKFNCTPKQTMDNAQKLYEAGLITYMRTDSVTLSKDALESIKEYITKSYGESYYLYCEYKNKSNNTQGAHEAIRPCDINKSNIEYLDNMSIYCKKLYTLIWKRTIACQMAPACISIYTTKISISNSEYLFIGKHEVIEFYGFLRVYKPYIEEEESNEEESDSLILFSKGDVLTNDIIKSEEKYTKSPVSRFTEASLIKDLTEKGIGRPSTYSNIVSLVQTRNYIEKYDKEGIDKEISIISLGKDNIISNKQRTIKLGAEKQKLFPTDIGKIVTKFLMKHFEILMDYTFTARVEAELDEISNGTKDWLTVVKSFYTIFQPKIYELLGPDNNNSLEKEKYNRSLGKDPISNKEVTVYIGQYGPCVCLRDPNTPKSNKYASLEKKSLETITLTEALELLAFPIHVGDYKDNPVYIQKGKYGLYVKHNNQNYRVPNGFSKNSSLEECINNIENKVTSEVGIIKKVNDSITIKTGRYGNYIEYKANGTTKPINVKIYSKKNPKEFTEEECLVLINRKLNQNK